MVAIDEIIDGIGSHRSAGQSNHIGERHNVASYFTNILIHSNWCQDHGQGTKYSITYACLEMENDKMVSPFQATTLPSKTVNMIGQNGRL